MNFLESGRAAQAVSVALLGSMSLCQQAWAQGAASDVSMSGTAPGALLGLSAAGGLIAGLVIAVMAGRLLKTSQSPKSTGTVVSRRLDDDQVEDVIRRADERWQIRLQEVGAHHRRELAAFELEIGDLKSELASTKEAAKIRIAELRGALAEMEAFNHTIAHDLKAPLTAMAGFGSLLVLKYGDSLPETGRAQLDRVLNKSREMAQMIDDLLRLSRIHKIELSDDEFDIGQLAHEALERERELAPERQVDISIDGESMAVRGDKGLSRILIRKLVSNAWKFSKERDIARIEVGSVLERSQKSGRLRRVFFVRDNGTGLDLEGSGVGSRLFTPFRRFHSESQFKGTGVGLAMCHRIVKRHRGDIWMESKDGQGATVKFTLADPDSEVDHGIGAAEGSPVPANRAPVPFGRFVAGYKDRGDRSSTGASDDDDGSMLGDLRALEARVTDFGLVSDLASIGDKVPSAPVQPKVARMSVGADSNQAPPVARASRARETAEAEADRESGAV